MNGYYTLFQSEANSEWYFNLKAGNHETILASEGYTQEAGALNGIESVRINSQIEDRYDRRESANGQWYFLLKAANGQTIGNSEMYTTEAARENGIRSVFENGPSTTIKRD